MSQQSPVASRLRSVAEKGLGLNGEALIPIDKTSPSLSSLSDKNGISSVSNLSTTSLNTSQSPTAENRNPPPISASFASCSYNSDASLSFSCLDSMNYPVFAPKYTIPQELMSPKSRLTGSGSDAITDGNAAGTANGALPPIGKITPPPQPEMTKKTKPLYYDTNICLTDFIKAVYGITGPTSGKGRDIGTTTLTKAERLRNRQLLYKNVSPLTSANDSCASSPKGTPSLFPQTPLGQKSRKLLLALDLDETLVHAFIGLKSPLPGADAHVEITTTLGNPPRKSVNAMYIKYRPHISEFMSAVAPLFDVVLFTAARPIYADTLMNVMDPKGSVISKGARYFRDSCTDVYNRYEAGSLVMSPKGLSTSIGADQSEKEEVAAVAAEAGCDTANGLPPLAEPGFIRTKDLAKLGRPLEEIILVDNTATCGLMQPRNLLPISSWFGTDMADRGLLDIVPVLKKIAATRDVYGCLDEYCASMQPVV